MKLVYTNTGRGGSFFKFLYDGFIEIRKEPASKKEFMNEGHSEETFAEYIALIKQLYGVCFLEKNNLALKYGSLKAQEKELESLWMRLIGFCIDHNLILEYADSLGNRMPARFPFDLVRFEFIYQYQEFPDIIHICTLDEFRLKVEMILAENADEMYLRYYYDVEITTKDGEEMLARFSGSFNKGRELIPLTKVEADELLSTIEGDLDKISQQIKKHCEKLPPRMGQGGLPRQKWLDVLKEQEEWLQIRIELDREYDCVQSCYDIVSTIIESGAHNDIYTDFPDETLYIHKGRIICIKQHHRIEQATAILMNRNGKDIELNVSHCTQCNKFFLDYHTYQHYREKYGTILGNIRMLKGENYSDTGYDLADESPLRLCGYSVSQKAGLSQADRQTIIESCIKNGAMTKEGVIRLLNWFIEVNGSKKGNELACRKWSEDLDFVLAYNTSRQNHYRITKIEQYNRNRYYIKGANRFVPLSRVQKENSSEKFIPYAGKRVVHKIKEYGSGIVLSETEKSIEVLFDNGKKMSLMRDAFEKGFLKIAES